MKNLFILLLSFLTVTAFTQTVGNNTVLAHRVTVEQVKKTLTDEHYKLWKYYTKDSIVVTNEKWCHRCSVKIWLVVIVKDSVAAITGQFYSHVGTYGNLTSYDPGAINQNNVRYATRGPNEKLFNELDRIAKLLSSNVTYESR
jgi:hypothetical protein